MNALLKFLTLVKLSLALLFLTPLTGMAQSLSPGSARLLEFEQKYVNRDLDTSKIPVMQNSQAQEYSPESAQIFEVKSYWVAASKLNVFETSQNHNDIDLKLRRVYKGEEQVLFLVHPESESFYEEFLKGSRRGPKFEATATASSRTLMMWQAGHSENAFFGKLSLNKKIGLVVRTLPQGEVARSVGVTEILYAAKDELPKDFAYLPEFFGAMPKGMERGGMILRAIPKIIREGKMTGMPLFALYTRPNEQTPSPIQKMLAQTKLSDKDFVLQRILRPFTKQWVDLVINHGIAIEAHAQNVLMEIDKNGMPTGKFIYRDFGGFNIDLAFRQSHGLAMPKNLPTIEGLEKDYHQTFHQKALQQSLQKYFEGGFLFGLGAELERLGKPDLNYQNLMELLRNEVKIEFAKRGIVLDVSRFYETLMPAIEQARTDARASQRIRCEAIL